MSIATPVAPPPPSTTGGAGAWACAAAGITVAEHLAAGDPGDGQAAAVGRGDGRLGDRRAGRELLRRLPDAVVQPREEDLRDAAVALEVDDAARAVAGEVDVAQRVDLGRAVDGLGGEPAGLGGGREGQEQQCGEGCEEAAHTVGSNRRGR